jgi:type IV secretion system protein VirB5
MSVNDFEKGATKTQAQRYQHQVKVNRAVSVQATYAFNDIKKHLTTIHQLSSRIDSTQNTKAALDLNARLMAEVAYIATQELKMQALLVESQAELNAARLNGEAETAKRNTLTE